MDDVAGSGSLGEANDYDADGGKRDQLKAIRAATGAVAFHDADGNLLGYLSPPLSTKTIAEAKRRLQSDGPWLSTKEVLAHLDSREQG